MNPKIEMIAYLPQHAIDILVRPHEEGLKINEEFKKWAEINANGAAFTCRRISDGKIIACAGVRIIWPGCGEAWALFCDEIVSYKKDSLVITRKYLWRIIEDFKLRRVQAYIRADNPAAINYVEHLGFKREGLLRKFGMEGEDQYIYAIVLED